MTHSRPWPNGLGFTVHTEDGTEVGEVHTHRGPAWGVRTSTDGGESFDRCMEIPASTRSGRLFPYTPEDAVALCQHEGGPTR